MANPRGRPKVFSGSTAAVRLPGLMDIRIKAQAEQTGKTVSDVIREALMPVFGGGESERPTK